MPPLVEVESLQEVCTETLRAAKLVNNLSLPRPFSAIPCRTLLHPGL